MLSRPENEILHHIRNAQASVAWKQERQTYADRTQCHDEVLKRGSLQVCKDDSGTIPELTVELIVLTISG